MRGVGTSQLLARRAISLCGEICFAIGGLPTLPSGSADARGDQVSTAPAVQATSR
jgi:hypothetical protein